MNLIEILAGLLASSVGIAVVVAGLIVLAIIA